MQKTILSEQISNSIALMAFVALVMGACRAFVGYVSVPAFRAYGRVLVVVAIVPRQVNRGGAGGGGGAIGRVVALFLCVLLIAYTFPSALTAVFTAQTSGWSTAGQALWPVIGLIGEVAALVLIIRTSL